MIRYLLENGAKLHGNVFIRPDPRGWSEENHLKELMYSTSIFHASKRAEDVTARLEIFLVAE